MKPVRIYLKNFMNHKNTEVDCTKFDSVLIVGKNRHNPGISNGVGKTTVFSAMEYALFNKLHASTLDRVVREGKKKATVEFDFELGGQTYRIHRHRTIRGAADLRLYIRQGDSWESISGRTPTVTEKKLADLISITHKAFTYSVLFRQADLTGISSLDDPKKRKEALKEPLNLVKYTQLEKIANEKAKPFKKDIDRIEGSIDTIGDPISDMQQAETEKAQCELDIQDREQKITRLVATIQTKRDTVVDLKASLGKEDTELHIKVTNQEVVVSDLNKKIQKLNVSIAETGQKLNDAEQQRRHIAQQIEQLETSIKAFENKTVRSSDEVDADYTQVRNDEAKGRALISSAQEDIAETKQSFLEDDYCVTCAQPISEEHRERHSKELERIIKQKEELIVYYEDNLKKCVAKAERLKKELAETQEHERALSSMNSLLTVKRVEHKTYQDRYDEAKKAIQELDVELAEATSALQDALKRFDELKVATGESNVSDINKKILALNEEIKLFEESVGSMRTEVSTLKAKWGAAEERAKTRTDDALKKAKLIQERNEIQEKMDIYKLTAQAFSPNGIPTFIIHTILDELQFETNYALKELRPELEIQMDAELNINYRRNGADRDYSQLSHGQKVYIALAFKRGMARVIQKKLGIDIRILEFDEVDAHLDEAGLTAFSDAIRKWQKEFKIFVVTHNRRLKDKFSHALMVEEGDDGAEGRLVTSW
jgi:DNA repair exonuclease SbcCD ATPase subunit